MDTKLFQDYGRRVIENCGKVIVGKDEVIRQVLVSFLCGGHVLLEDALPVPVWLMKASYPVD